MKKYIGVDLSITSPGISCIDKDGNILWMKFFAHKPKHEGKFEHNLEGLLYPVYSTDTERFHKICTTLVELILKEIKDGHEVKVGLEGYSYGSTASRLFQIAENGGHFKFLCWQAGIDVDIVAPSAVKKLATGKGNSNKEVVYMFFVEKYGIKLDRILGFKTDKAVSPISDVADSVWMAEWRRLKDNGKL